VNWYDNITGFGIIDAFKGGLDLNGNNANFGKRYGIEAAFPLVQSWGLGAQLSTSFGYYDWKGSQFTGSKGRFQNFTTIGLFQRSCDNGLSFGAVYDWLYDDYYQVFHFGQFRVAAAYLFNPQNEFGFWGSLPDRRDWAVVGTPPVNNNYAPVLQGNLFWRHIYSPAASTTTYIGLAESPADIPFGSSTQIALTKYMAFYGGFAYILPGSGGTQGHQEEIWNVSFGVSIYPGSGLGSQISQFRPVLPLADNGNFAIRRR
jgi:hypothetical protein